MPDIALLLWEYSYLLDFYFSSSGRIADHIERELFDVVLEMRDAGLSPVSDRFGVISLEQASWFDYDCYF